MSDKAEVTFSLTRAERTAVAAAILARCSTLAPLANLDKVGADMPSVTNARAKYNVLKSALKKVMDAV